MVAASAVLRAVSSYQAVALFRFHCVLQVDPERRCDENSDGSRLRRFASDRLTTRHRDALRRSLSREIWPDKARNNYRTRFSQELQRETRGKRRPGNIYTF